MSWLSQGLQDIGLGGLNTFWNSAIEPALENPIVDIGLGLGATALTGGLLAPELGALFGADAAATAAAPAVDAFGDIAATAPTSLAAADASAAPLAFADPALAAGDAGFPFSLP